MTAATLTSYVNSGHSAYIAAGTADVAVVPNEATIWDSFTQQYGLDFGLSYNAIIGKVAVAESDPLFAGVSELYFNSGNTVSVYGSAQGARIVTTQNGAGLIGVYEGASERVAPQLDAPKPATLALLGLGLAGLGSSRRRSLN